MARQQVAFPKRGEVWLTDFDPTVGAEIRKTRPALIIQNDIGNRFSPIVIIAAITSSVALVLYRRGMVPVLRSAHEFGHRGFDAHTSWLFTSRPSKWTDTPIRTNRTFSLSVSELKYGPQFQYP